MLPKIPTKTAAGSAQQQCHLPGADTKRAYLQDSLKSTEDLRGSKDLPNGFLQEDTKREKNDQGCSKVWAQTRTPFASWYLRIAMLQVYRKPQWIQNHFFFGQWAEQGLTLQQLRHKLVLVCSKLEFPGLLCTWALFCFPTPNCRWNLQLCRTGLVDHGSALSSQTSSDLRARVHFATRKQAPVLRKYNPYAYIWHHIGNRSLQGALLLSCLPSASCLCLSAIMLDVLGWCWFPPVPCSHPDPKQLSGIPWCHAAPQHPPCAHLLLFLDCRWRSPFVGQKKKLCHILKGFFFQPSQFEHIHQQCCKQLQTLLCRHWGTQTLSSAQHSLWILDTPFWKTSSCRW